MQIIEEVLPIDKSDIQSIAHALPVDPEKCVFFDIETTGLQVKISNVYLIGCATISGDNVNAKFFFADDYTSEKSLLEAFSDYISDYQAVVHYNGSGFDIPYLEKKCITHGLPSPFLSPESLDVYKYVIKHKYNFRVPNKKLATIEKYVGFERTSTVFGKECITVYADYMQHKFAHRDKERDACLDILLAHNRDDIIGTMHSSKLYIYDRINADEATASLGDDSLTVTYNLPDGIIFPVEISSEMPYMPGTVSYKGSEMRVDILLSRGVKYHFFKDYKDYYYLPDEDMAVHKSVGGFVDKEHRRKATASNCYVKKEGVFLPLPIGYHPNDIIYTDPDKKIQYIEIDENYSASAEMISFLL